MRPSLRDETARATFAIDFWIAILRHGPGEGQDKGSTSTGRAFRCKSDGGIDRDGPAVTRLLSWVARASGQSPDTHYAMSRHDAAVLLNLAAGWPYAR
jgi:hypothetical protein